MPKRSSYQIRKQILLKVKEKPATYAELERKINTGYRSVKTNCEELSEYDLIEIETVGKHPANGKPSHIVKITEKGLKALKK
ncbi:MAG: hypothetical protein AABX05_05675 [Nanoarchaeota archaeon]